MDAGDPGIGAYFPAVAGNRVLPDPSPSANLAGVWEDKRLKCKPPLARRFFIFSLACPSEKEGYALQT